MGKNGAKKSPGKTGACDIYFLGFDIPLQLFIVKFQSLCIALQ